MANQANALFSLSDDSCKWQLLSKDGVYLETAPRNVTFLELTSGSRCDVLVQCSGAVEQVDITMTQIDYPPVLDDTVIAEEWIILSLLVSESTEDLPEVATFQVG